MISVILTVHNVEKYLHVCLNSILNQTFRDFEVICIDDASDDSSLEILEFFAIKDSRIKIFKNKFYKGSSYSRNKGLEIAKNKYIFFLDGEGWIDNNTFEILLNQSEENKLDVLMFSEEYRCFESKIINHFDLGNKLFELPYSNITNFYLKEFLNDNKIIFKDDDCSSEFTFFFKVMTHAGRILFLNEELYNTQKTLKSFNDFIEEHVFDNIDIIYSFFEVFYENMQLYAYYKKFLLKYIFETVLDEKYETIENKYKSKFFILIQNVYKKFVLDYELYEDIRESVNQMILTKYKFNETLENLNEQNPKVSVIIPVYNVKEYLPTCLESVINQTLSDIEIICIDDGSTDESSEILNYYSRFKNIKVITQKNCGLGCARNSGLDCANGDYIFFLDSDDFILGGTLESLYNNAISNDSDIVISKIARFDDFGFNYSIPGFPLDNEFEKVNFNDFTFNYKNIKKYVLNASFSACLKLYKKEFLERSDEFRFQTGIAYEDVLFHVKCLLKSNKISFVPKYFYQYRLSNPNSIIHGQTNIWDIFIVCDSVEEFLQENGLFEEFKIEFSMFKITQLSQYISMADSDDYLKSVKKEFELMDYVNIDVLPPNLQNIYTNIVNSQND